MSDSIKPQTRQHVDKAKLERARLRRLAAETKNVQLQKELLQYEYPYVLRQFEGFYLGRISSDDAALKAEAQNIAKNAADAWLANQRARLDGDSARKPGDKADASLRPKASVQLGKRPQPDRLEQNTALIARVCSQIAELEREAGLAPVLGERDLDELRSRRSPSDTEEIVTVHGSDVTVETLVNDKAVVQDDGVIKRRPLWARHSAIATVTIAQEPKAFEPVRKRLLAQLSHVGMVLLKRSTRDSIVGQCILELGVPVVWFDSDNDLASLQAAIREDDQRSFTAGAMAELRGAIFYLDRIEGEIEGDRQAVQIRADEARANVMRDESTPLPGVEPLIKRLEERCARELDHYIEWAGEQMRTELNALESRVKLQVAQALEHYVLSEPESITKPVADNDRMTVTVSDQMINDLANLTEGIEGKNGIAQLQSRLAYKSSQFWETRLRDCIIQKSLMTLPDAAFEAIKSKLDKESFRAVDDAADMRMRRVAVDAFREARDKEIVPIAVPREPNLLTPFGYMKKVTGSVFSAISSILVVMAIFGLGLGFFKRAFIADSESGNALPLAIILTIVVYIAAWVWAKRDYSRARGAAAEKLRIATLRAHSEKLAAFENTWRKNLSVSMKASLRDTLRRLKVDLREQMDKLRVPEEVQRLERTKIAQHFENEIKRLSVTAGQAARLRAQLADQQKQLVKNLKQVLSQGAGQ